MMVPFVIVWALAVQDSAPRRVESVPAVDLRRYAGLWYEVARFPNPFQQGAGGRRPRPTNRCLASCAS